MKTKDEIMDLTVFNLVIVTKEKPSKQPSFKTMMDRFYLMNACPKPEEQPAQPVHILH